LAALFCGFVLFLIHKKSRQQWIMVTDRRIILSKTRFRTLLSGVEIIDEKVFLMKDLKSIDVEYEPLEASKMQAKFYSPILIFQKGDSYKIPYSLRIEQFLDFKKSIYKALGKHYEGRLHSYEIMGNKYTEKEIFEIQQKIKTVLLILLSLFMVFCAAKLYIDYNGSLPSWVDFGNQE
jgi:hypothetical protein